MRCVRIAEKGLGLWPLPEHGELMDWEDMTDFREAPEHPQLRSRTRGSEFRGEKEIIAKVREGFLEEL